MSDADELVVHVKAPIRRLNVRQNTWSDVPQLLIKKHVQKPRATDDDDALVTARTGPLTNHAAQLRATSARANAHSARKKVALSATSTRTTIFHAKRQETTTKCGKTCCFAEAERAVRENLLPAYEGTFGPPKPDSAPHVAKDYLENEPLNSSMLRQLRPIVAPPPSIFDATQEGIEAQERIAAFENNAARFEKTGEPSPFFNQGTVPSSRGDVADLEVSAMGRSRLMRTGSMIASTSWNGPSRPQRHQLQVLYLQQQGALRRSSAFAVPLPNSGEVQPSLVSQVEPHRRSPTISEAGSSVNSIRPSASTQGAGPNALTTMLKAADQAIKIMVSLMVNTKVADILVCYRRFIQKRKSICPAPPRPTPFVSLRSGNVHASFDVPPTPRPPVAGTVNHQQGMTQQQFKDFVKEIIFLAAEKQEAPSPFPLTDAVISASFQALGDFQTKRVIITDVLVGIGLQIVPRVAQTRAEFFVSTFDSTASGIVPRNIFHPHLVSKYAKNIANIAVRNQWSSLSALLAELLQMQEPNLCFMLSEVCAPPTSLAVQNALVIPQTPDELKLDPGKVFTGNPLWANAAGGYAPLSITVREALATIYTTAELVTFFSQNTLDVAEL